MLSFSAFGRQVTSFDGRFFGRFRSPLEAFMQCVQWFSQCPARERGRAGAEGGERLWKSAFGGFRVAWADGVTGPRLRATPWAGAHALRAPPAGHRGGAAGARPRRRRGQRPRPIRGTSAAFMNRRDEVDMPGQVRVFIACSVDGFIAGEGGDLSWLPAQDDGDDGFARFFAGVGALLMGRRTFDAVQAFGVPWPYEDRPVLVATSRPLDPVVDGVTVTTLQAVRGPIEALVAQARAAAGERDVYLDGGAVIRQALDAGLVDALTLFVVPIVLGNGHPLFAGVEQRHRLELVANQTTASGMVRLDYRAADYRTP